MKVFRWLSLAAALLAPLPAVAQSGGAIGGGGTVTKLGQSTLPFVLLPSGSFGNNGAWTTTNAAQATAYPNAYCFVPAGAIAAGSLAGWYYCTFSTTQAATLFNNTYTSGTPTIPASPTAFVTTGPGAYTQTTGSNIAAYTLAIAGNTIGLNGSICVMGMRSHNNTAGNKTLTLNYSTYAPQTLAATTTIGGGFLGGFTNRGAANVQVNFGNLAMGGFGVSSTANTVNYGAIDSTQSQNFIFNLQLATATDTMVLESAVVELMPGVP